ncbi:MAG TPA: nuclear transport factor 2 family protein [Jatrophihabitans sp.]|nr:nuclear transport factor 2 family protein [Jatrophihabitans sp.]
MTTPDRDKSVTVLGLGRIGSAMAQRLAACGWQVTTWTRSGRTLTGLDTAARVDAAVAASNLVILSLFDGPACAQVIDAAAAGLAPGTVVINTSTVGPDEAAALGERVARAGARYVHAPVLGSVGPARSGELSVLAGAASPDDIAAATRLLADLGTVLTVGGVADAAMLKLIANGALAAVLLAIRDALTQAQSAGIDRDRALEALAESAVGGMVGAKRQRLATGDVTLADFTVAALAKDLTLLASASGPGAPSLAGTNARIASGQLTPEDDIAAVALPDAGPGADRHSAIRLTVAPGVEAADDVLAPLVAYATGHATGDPAHFRRAFLPSAHIEGLRDGTFVSWPVDTYCALFTGEPDETEPAHRRRIDQVSVAGTVATATMTLWHGPATFTDVFLLVRTEDGWKIANKAYHRH